MLYVLYNIVNAHHCMFLWGIELLPNFSCSSNIKILNRKICLCNAMIEINTVLGVLFIFSFEFESKKIRLLPQMFHNWGDFSRRHEFKLKQFKIPKCFRSEVVLSCLHCIVVINEETFFLTIMSLHIFHNLCDLLVCALVLLSIS